MGIFKKTIKYSKPSKDLDSKIKNLDEELKQTGVIIDKNNDKSLCIQESSVQELPDVYDQIPVEREEEKLYDWRESFLIEENNDEFLKDGEDENDYKSITRVETYISESNRQLIEIRDQIFDEISKSTLLNLPEIKYKIERVLEIYDEIHEGLLNEPPEIKNEDPLTPINQNFVTIDELNRHYTLFINRVQEQLSTIGGGGETKLKYLDDIVGIATNASSYDGKFLKYDHSLGKFVFETVSGGGGGAVSNYAPIAGFATYAGNVGFATFSGVAGFATNAIRAGVATFSTFAGTSGFSTVSSVAGFSTVASVAGFATNATRSGVSTLASYSYSAGFSTVSTVAGVATFATISAVSGFSTVSTQAGISTSVIGGVASVTALNVIGLSTFAGLATYTAPIFGTQASFTGVITASSFSGSGSNLSGLTGASANTYGNGSAVPQIIVDANGRITSITNVAISGGGGGGSGVFVNNGSLVGFAGTINFTPNTITVSPLSAGIVTANVIAAPNAGFATFARWAGISTIASVAGFATYSTSAGVSTLSQGLTGTPNVTVGIITATRFVGSGISLTGIVTSITAGSGISINQSTGNVTITATGGAGSQTLDQTLALGNSSSRGLSVGVLTATSFSGDGSTLTNILVRDVNGNLIAGQGAADGAALPATASNNVIIGNNSAGNTLDPSFLGDENVFIGQESGYFVTSGAQNVLIGLYAGYQIREGNTNVYLGKDAGRNTKSGDNNVSIGHYSGELNDTGNNNVFVGSFTGISTDASNKVIIGSGGGSGFNFDAPDPSKNIQLAIGVKVDSITPTGYWIVGDENYNVGIGTTNPTSKLDVVGNAKFTGVVTATSFVGDGSQLTGISASSGPSIDLLEVMLFS